jgi:hypothetical protein
MTFVVSLFVITAIGIVMNLPVLAISPTSALAALAELLPDYPPTPRRLGSQINRLLDKCLQVLDHLLRSRRSISRRA